MEKKLYCVKVVLYVMAVNESEARSVATQVRFDIFECTANKAKFIDPDWNDAIPYNADDDRTCSEILFKTQKTSSAELFTMALPPSSEKSVRVFEIESQSVQSRQQT